MKAAQRRLVDQSRSSTTSSVGLLNAKFAESAVRPYSIANTTGRLS